MAESYEICCERADAAAAAAKTATLDNVKKREFRAEKTWRGLAEQARKVKLDREKAQREKEERRDQQFGSE